MLSSGQIETDSISMMPAGVRYLRPGSTWRAFHRRNVTVTSPTGDRIPESLEEQHQDSGLPGIENSIVVPSPGTLVAVISPPCARTSSRAIERPRPVPLESDPFTNRSKIVGSCSGGFRVRCRVLRRTIRRKTWWRSASRPRPPGCGGWRW